MSKNPFPLVSYSGPDTFCDREKETRQLIQAVENGRNTLLISLRRMGKTSLILHVFEQLKQQKEVNTIYLDIMNTHSIDDFLNILATSVLQSYQSRSKKLFDGLIKFLKTFNPVISFDAITGAPSIELISHSQSQARQSIERIFDYLENQNKPIYIAIDEFQQITRYKDEGFEAYLRSKIQHLQKVNFIFCGSMQHLLTQMFSNASRPFYQSADYLKLERIDPEVYATFITGRFKASRKEIPLALVLETLDWLDGYTFYVQNFFNKLWFLSRKTVDEGLIEETKKQLLAERQYIYDNLPNLLTHTQYQLLKAIAINGNVTQPNSKQFIQTYQLGTASTINSALKALITKELIYQEKGLYKIYDVFLSRWLEKK